MKDDILHKLKSCLQHCKDIEVRNQCIDKMIEKNREEYKVIERKFDEIWDEIDGHL